MEEGPYGERPCGVHAALAVGVDLRKREKGAEQTGFIPDWSRSLGPLEGTETVRPIVRQTEKNKTKQKLRL